LTLYLHRELGQNRHHWIAWSPILRWAQTNVLQKRAWIATNPICAWCCDPRSRPWMKRDQREND
jgi:hypothetical protein